MNMLAFSKLHTMIRINSNFTSLMFFMSLEMYAYFYPILAFILPLQSIWPARWRFYNWLLNLQTLITSKFIQIM